MEAEQEIEEVKSKNNFRWLTRRQSSFILRALQAIYKLQDDQLAAIGLHQQSGVIPYRLVGDKVEILLITSIRRGRWIIPKGIVEPHLSPAESACQEAWEEAGVVGRVDSQPFGFYQYAKWGGICQVTVFLLHVQTVHEEWPEQMYRQRQWLSIAEAAKSVEEVQLRDLILRMRDYLISVTD